MTLADWQWQIGDVVLDATPGSTEPYRLLSFEGLERELRSQDQDRPLDHGSVFGTDFMTGRTLTLEIMVVATASTLQTTLDTLSAEWAPILNTTTLSMKHPGSVERFVRGRPRRFAVEPQTWGLGYVKVAAEFVCPTPYIFGTQRTGATTPMDQTIGGLSFTADTFPSHPGAGGLTFTADTYPTHPGAGGLTFTQAVGTGSLLLNNQGGYNAPWEILLSGPLTGPALQHTGTGQRIALSGNLAAGETLLLKSEDHTVTMGGANRYSLLSEAEWFDIAPGDNTVRLTSDTAGETGTFSITFYDTYI